MCPVGGAPSPELTPQDIEVRRALLYDYWRWACGYPESPAVSELHPRYVAVTEGRDTGAAYSSCADLAHAGWQYLGNRRPWINRAPNWKRGVNVWRIVEQCVPWVGLVTPGDVIITANDRLNGSDAHVICVLALLGDRLHTAEYGQPGGALKSYPMGPTLAGRAIRWRLPFEVELRRAFHAGLLGPLGKDPTTPSTRPSATGRWRSYRE